jgi:hypothetical protein
MVRLGGDWLGRNFDVFGVPPQPFEIVVASGSVEENVDNEIAVIHQDPLGVVISFDTDGQVAALLEPEMDFIGDRLILADVGAGTDDEMVGEAGDITQIENNNVQSFFGLRRAYCFKPRGIRNFRDLLRRDWYGKIFVLLADSALLSLSYYNNRSASNRNSAHSLCPRRFCPGTVCDTGEIRARLAERRCGLPTSA